MKAYRLNFWRFLQILLSSEHGKIEFSISLESTEKPEVEIL